jgi:hypothetical protein
LNSGSTTGNPTTAYYWFAASENNLTSPVANTSLTQVPPGVQQISGSAYQPNGANLGDTVTGATIGSILAFTPYYIYAQACPQFVSANGANCSNWIKIASGQFKTANLPTSVFLTPVKGDITINGTAQNTINIRANVPDPSNVTNMILSIQNLDAATAPTALSPNAAYNQSTQQAPIGPATTPSYAFIPNTHYQYIGQVTYPWSQVAPATAQNEPFYTTPANPDPLSPVVSFTHCSVQINVQNALASAAFGNPSTTNYQVCVNPGNVCATQAIGGTGAQTDQKTFTIAGLTDGTPYTSNAVAQNEGGATNWNNSTTVPGPGFTTLAWGGTFTVGAIGNTDVFLNVSVSNPSGIQSWQIKSGATVLASGSGDPSPGSPYHITGLAPNTQFTPVIVLTEASGCSSNALPFTPATFVTTPFAPTAGTGTATGPTAITANWTDGSANPAGTTYQVNYCLNSGFTGCATKNVAKVAGAAQTTNLTGLTEETPYYIEVKTLDVVQPAGADNQDSGYFQFTNNPITTLNAPPIVPVPTCAQIGTSNTANCSVSGVVENDLTDGVGVEYQWSVVPAPAGTSFAPATTLNSSSNSNSTVFSYPSAQPYTVTVTVTDHNGAGLSTSSSVLFNPGHIPTTITVSWPGSPAPAIVATGNSTAANYFTATVLDQNGVVMPGEPVNWTVAPVSAGNSVSPVSGPSTAFTAGTTTGNFTLHADLPGATGGTAAITVVPSGIIITTPPTITLNTLKTGILTTAASDNVLGANSINYTWSLVSGPGAVSFSPNGNNVAQNSVVTFTAAGDYVFRCTYSNADGSTSAVTPSTTVVQGLAQIQVCPQGESTCPAVVTVPTLQTQQFSATGIDQFGNAMPVGSVTWTTSLGNFISAAGAFDTTAINQSITVTATAANGKSGSITVNTISFDVSGAYAYPVPYKASFGTGIITFAGLGTQASIHIYTASGRRVFDTQVNNCADQTKCFQWDVKNSSGESLASGVYFYVIQSPQGKKNGKLIIIQ